MRSCSVSGNFFPFFNDNSVVFIKVHQKRRQIEVMNFRSKSATVFVAIMGGAAYVFTSLVLSSIVFQKNIGRLRVFLRLLSLLCRVAPF